jgi:hypothetical protein
MSPSRLARSLAAAAVTLGACSGGDDAGNAARRTLPALSADIVAPRGETQQQFFQRQVLLINKWVRQAALPPAASVTLLDVVRQSRLESGKLVTLRPDQLATALQAWLKAAQTKDSVRQAAAYLVADRVLRLAWRPFGLADSTQNADIRGRLKTLGAASEYSEASGEVTYAGAWLQQAARLDPNGPMGQRAVLLQLEADCAGGDSPEPYHAIARRLDALVASPADSEVRATAQIMQADAYRDIVALAHGLGKDNADSMKFLADADSARTRAIALYQAALAGDTTSRLAHGGQTTLARLTSGLPPDHVRFFCFAQ